MTERKPPGVSFESWVDRQIREASERGAFSDLPGAGRPLSGVDQPYDENWWIKRKLHEEGVSVLPPTLALRKEAEDALAAARAARTDAEARRVLTEINATIDAALRRPLAGPPLNLVPFDVEQVLAERRAAAAGD
ncbi:DnaJ family domain-containing protein [Streptomyces sp. GSL17-111]|uniref:DnaJ family domain-containing protein n=1 Tax=Streptomyces sp. GSL17-111 TaxID=3121596 RepID=UPI0030F43799